MDFFKKQAFTLSEVLITLAIIGVVAAVTLPVLINKINDKQYDISRKKFYGSFGEAIRLLAVEGNLNQASNAEDFIKNYLSRKLKIAKYCGNSTSDCGFSDKIKKLGSEEQIDMPYSDTGMSFLTNDGFSVYLFYNNKCGNKYQGTNYYHAENYCVNAIYDMNGKRNPNQAGKDVGFITAKYPNEEIKVSNPLPTAKDAGNNGNEVIEQYRAGNLCGKGETLPDMEELYSMYINKRFLANFLDRTYWSSTVITSDLAYSIQIQNGLIYRTPTRNTYFVRCVKR